MISKTPIGTSTHEEHIKKSVFVGVCAPIDSPKAFETFYQAHADPEATHNCWAYRIGQTYRFNDDGEPSGTAGMPILSAINGAGFDHVAALVIRYYGGIKLGTGGLARAYGGTISKLLQQVAYQPLIAMSDCEVTVPFAHSQTLHRTCTQFDGAIKNQVFQNSGVQVTIQLPSTNKIPFADQLNNSTKGQAIVVYLDD